jgi:hypothetical protein
MSCCGSYSPIVTLTERHRFRIHYYGGLPIVVRGPVTGAEYRFSGKQRVQFVDPRDAVRILRKGMFRMAGLTEV